MRHVPLALLCLLVACPSDEEETEPCAFEEEGAVHPELTDQRDVVGPDDRQARLILPFGYDGRTALPVVFLLHGYGATAGMQDFLFKFADRVDEYRFILVMPNGTRDGGGATHWNATDACCDSGMNVDDVGYLTGLLDELEERFRVDPARVYFTGHSNGGFMSYRMACEIPERIAAILPLAGATWFNDADCGASESVAVLHAHGDSDETILYEGEPNQPGALASVTTWAARSGCDVDAAVDGEPIDLLNTIDGPETRVVHWTEGCGCGLETTLWTLEGTGHIPPLTDRFAEHALNWLFAHRKF
jgi:polyhydroxybutyrate depolymerase